MATSTKGEVRGGGALADQAVAIVDLLLLLGGVADNRRSVGGVGAPSVRVPSLRLREVLRVRRADARGSEEGVRGRDDELGAGNGHGLLDCAHDGVNGGVEAKGLLDDGLVERQLAESFVGQRGEVFTQDILLLLEKLLNNLGVLGKTQHDPRAGGRRRVLASHEQGNHHVRNLVVGNLDAVLVGRVHKMSHHVELLVIALGAALLDDIHVDLSHSLLGIVTLAVPGERGPVQHKVDRSEAHIQIVVEGGQGLVKSAANGAALQGVGGSENGDLGHVLGNIDDARLGLEGGALLEVGLHLAGDDGNVGSEGIGGKGNLHELFASAPC